jgi:hypothetical protein
MLSFLPLAVFTGHIECAQVMLYYSVHWFQEMYAILLHLGHIPCTYMDTVACKMHARLEAKYTKMYVLYTQPLA